MLKMEVNKEEIRYLLQFFFDEAERKYDRRLKLCLWSQYCKTNYVQFSFRRFRWSNRDTKDASCIGRPVVENVDKITEIIEVDRHVRSRNIAQ